MIKKKSRDPDVSEKTDVSAETDAKDGKGEDPENKAPAAEPKPSANAMPAVPKALKELDGHYTAGEWAGIPQLRCAHCAWDTLNGPEALRDHLFATHLDHKMQPRQILVADKSGNAKK